MQLVNKKSVFLWHSNPSKRPKDRTVMVVGGDLSRQRHKISPAQENESAGKHGWPKKNIMKIDAHLSFFSKHRYFNQLKRTFSQSLV